MLNLLSLLKRFPCVIAFNFFNYHIFNLSPVSFVLDVPPNLFYLALQSLLDSINLIQSLHLYYYGQKFLSTLAKPPLIDMHPCGTKGCNSTSCQTTIDRHALTQPGYTVTSVQILGSFPGQNSQSWLGNSKTDKTGFPAPQFLVVKCIHYSQQFHAHYFSCFNFPLHQFIITSRLYNIHNAIIC